MSRTFRIVTANLPGAGRQKPTTECALIEEAVVVNASAKALQIRLPIQDRTIWLARSQCATLPDVVCIDKFSKVGDYATLCLPLFIFRKMFPHGKRAPLSQK